MGFEYYEQQGAPKLDLLDKPSQLALLLAHEKPQGADSFFFPYVDALPDWPSAAWALDDVQLDAALAALPAAVTADERARWREEAVRQRGVIEAHSQRTWSSCVTHIMPPTHCRLVVCRVQWTLPFLSGRGTQNDFLFNNCGGLVSLVPLLYPPQHTQHTHTHPHTHSWQ